MLSGLRLATRNSQRLCSSLSPASCPFSSVASASNFSCGPQPGARRSTRPRPDSRSRPRARGRERSAARSSAGESSDHPADLGAGQR